MTFLVSEANVVRNIIEESKGCFFIATFANK